MTAACIGYRSVDIHRFERRMIMFLQCELRANDANAEENKATRDEMTIWNRVRLSRVFIFQVGLLSVT